MSHLMIKCRVTYKWNRKPIQKQGNHEADRIWKNFSLQEEIIQVELNNRMFDAKYVKCIVKCAMLNIKAVRILVNSFCLKSPRLLIDGGRAEQRVSKKRNVADWKHVTLCQASHGQTTGKRRHGVDLNSGCGRLALSYLDRQSYLTSDLY